MPGGAKAIATQWTAHDYSEPGEPPITRDDAAARGQLVDVVVADGNSETTTSRLAAPLAAGQRTVGADPGRVNTAGGTGHR